MPEKLFTVPELAAVLISSERFAWSLVASGEIESLKIGALRRVRASAIDRYLESRTPDADHAAAV